MARPAITYTETFKCPYCDKKAVVHVPNATVSHPCRENNKLKLVEFDSIDIWRREEEDTEDKKVYKQGILNL